MKHPIRIAIASTAMLFGLAVAGSSTAQAQVSFQGTFPLPHGQISIGIGNPAFRVGAYAPAGYPIVSQAGYGYGFHYHNSFVPVHRVGPRWVVCDPYAAAPAYADPYAYGYGYGSPAYGYAPVYGYYGGYVAYYGGYYGGHYHGGHYGGHGGYYGGYHGGHNGGYNGGHNGAYHGGHNGGNHGGHGRHGGH